MVLQIAGLGRHTHALQIGRCSNDDGLPMGHGPGHDIAIVVIPSHHESDIKLVHPRRRQRIHQDIEHERGIQHMPRRQQRCKKVRGQQGGRQHANGAAQVAGARRGGGLGVVDFVQDGAHPLQIGLAGIGQGQLAGGALQQPRAQVLLQIGHQPGHDGGRQLHQPCRSSKAPLFDDGLKHTHGQQSVHFGNKVLFEH